MKSSSSKYHECLYFSTSALARKVEKLAIACWKPASLSPSHGYLLLLVIEKPGINPKTLTQQLLLTPSTITRLIQKLEEKELVTRIVEGKNTAVFPTDTAIDFLPILNKCIATFKSKCCSALGTANCDCMVNEIHKLADIL